MTLKNQKILNFSEGQMPLKSLAIYQQLRVSSVHKKHNELVHLLKSGRGEGGERGEGD